MSGDLYRWPASAGEGSKDGQAPYREADLKLTVLKVLDQLLAGIEPGLVRVGLSTTRVTNLLATGGGETGSGNNYPGPGLITANWLFLPIAFWLGGTSTSKGGSGGFKSRPAGGGSPLNRRPGDKEGCGSREVFPPECCPERQAREAIA